MLLLYYGRNQFYLFPVIVTRDLNHIVHPVFTGPHLPSKTWVFFEPSDILGDAALFILSVAPTIGIQGVCCVEPATQGS